MGLAAKDRPALEAGLNKMRIIKDMPACVSGATFDWPQVVFESPDQAGNAVGVALQDATCTFTVAPHPSATPGPPPAVPGAVPGDPGPRPRRPDRPDLGATGRAGPGRRRLPGAVRRGRRRLHRIHRGRVAQDDRHGPGRAGGVRLSLRGRRGRRGGPGAVVGRDRRHAWSRRPRPPSRRSARSTAPSR